MLFLSWKLLHYDARLGVGDGSDQEGVILRLLPLFASSSSYEDHKFFYCNFAAEGDKHSLSVFITMKTAALLST